MLKAESPDRFRADFSRVRRKGAWWKVFEPRAVVVVDAYAIAQAVTTVMGSCPFKSATGQPQVWNEYRVFLSRADHDRLRPIEASLQKELGKVNIVSIDSSAANKLVVDFIASTGRDGRITFTIEPAAPYRTAGISGEFKRPG